MKNCQEIVFIGNPEFGAIVLKKLAEEYKLSLVITSPDKPAKRGKKLTPTSVKETAKKLKLPIFETEDNSEIFSKLKEIKPDLLVSAACGQILPKEVLEIPTYRSLNVHPSLLPRHRGCSPIQTAILKGDKKTGVTIFLMDEKIDHGKIIAQKEHEIGNKNYSQLEKELGELGAELLIDIIPKWTKDEIKAKEQKGESSYAPTLKKEDGRIDWFEKAEQIERKVRAFYSWPGTFAFWKENDKRIKILEIEAKDFKENLEPGKTFLKDNLLCVKCKDKSLVIKKIQLEGKKPMSSEEFLRGNSEIIGSVLK